MAGGGREAWTWRGEGGHGGEKGDMEGRRGTCETRWGGRGCVREGERFFGDGLEGEDIEG